MRPASPALRLGLVSLLSTAALAACADVGRAPAFEARAAERGASLVQAYGCLGCHVVPGMRPSGFIGPPLTDFAERRHVAGSLANTRENLVRWIMAPQDVDQGTAMPDLGVSEAEARDMAAFLLTLGRDQRPSPKDPRPPRLLDRLPPPERQL